MRAKTILTVLFLLSLAVAAIVVLRALPQEGGVPFVHEMIGIDLYEAWIAKVDVAVVVSAPERFRQEVSPRR